MTVTAHELDELEPPNLVADESPLALLELSCGCRVAIDDAGGLHVTPCGVCKRPRELEGLAVCTRRTAGVITLERVR